LTLETGLPISRVSVSNPAVAEPIAISPTQLLINGLAPGTVTLVLWPKEGAAIVYELVVHIDSAALEQQMQAIFPEEHVRVQTSKDSIVLTGPVSSTDMAEKLMKLATDYSPKVVNHMAGPGAARKQVMLKVKFAEVSKSALTEFASVLHHVDPTNPAGSDRGSSGTGQFNPPRGNLLNNPAGPELTWGDAINLSFFEKSLDLGLFITALKQRGLFQELAEPTLIAADGQEANFLAGGEFPVPVAQPGANFVAITVVWKKFGISLDFKPTIHNDGVIVMKVKPEVSSLDFANGVLIEGFRIPSLIVRRAETEVELKDGQSFAIAGLYDRNLANTKSKIPVLGDIPLLGHLFRSKSLEKNRTELLVIVTPQIVEPLGTGKELPTLEMPETFDDTEKPVKT
jgi:pilus assembly protein CpaC